MEVTQYHTIKQKVTKNWSKKRLAYLVALILLAAVGAVALYRFVGLQAATVSTAVEAENGSINAPATKIADASASNFQAVRFGDAPTQPTPTPTPTDSKPVGVGGSWTLKFSDEFEGNSIDLSKWLLCNPSFASVCNPWNNEREKFNVSQNNNANVKVSGGQLHLVATKEANGQIMSGMVSTGPIPAKFGGYNQPGYKPFTFTYGYYEGRVKLPKGNGFWPSMWMLPDQDRYGAWPGSGEYDVFEIPGNNPSEYHFTAHWGGGGGQCGHPCTPQQATISDSSANWHVFGFDWQPTGLTWYVDGKKMGNTITDPGAIKSHPFYIIANFSVGGDWGPLKGAPDGSTPFPASYDIDYLRVWQH